MCTEVLRHTLYLVILPQFCAKSLISAEVLQVYARGFHSGKIRVSIVKTLHGFGGHLIFMYEVINNTIIL